MATAYRPKYFSLWRYHVIVLPKVTFQEVYVVRDRDHTLDENCKVHREFALWGPAKVHLQEPWKIVFRRPSCLHGRPARRRSQEPMLSKLSKPVEGRNWRCIMQAWKNCGLLRARSLPQHHAKDFVKCDPHPRRHSTQSMTWKCGRSTVAAASDYSPKL